MSKFSHDGKFIIVYENSSNKVHLNTGKEVSVWEIAHAVYIDCICDPHKEAETLKCIVKTNKNQFEFTVKKEFSITETLSVICDNIKL